MKKRFSATILSLLAAVMCSFGMAACEQSQSDSSLQSSSGQITESSESSSIESSDSSESGDDSSMESSDSSESSSIESSESGDDSSVESSESSESSSIEAEWLAIFKVSGNAITGLTDRGKKLSEIVIPSTIDGVQITSIGDYAFYGCESLTSITIPDSITSWGSTFYGCESLTEINVDQANTAYQSIDGNLYTKDGKTLIQYAIGKTATSFTIPDSVTSIGSSAFYNCSSLTSVTIPDGVTSIGWYAFYNCSGLTSVYYKGAKSEWDQISIGDSNYELISATRYYYRATQPTTSGNYWRYVDGVPTVW